MCSERREYRFPVQIDDQFDKAVTVIGYRSGNPFGTSARPVGGTSLDRVPERARADPGRFHARGRGRSQVPDLRRGRGPIDPIRTPTKGKP